MKIEPGTLCVVKQSFFDPALRGRMVVVERLGKVGDLFPVRLSTGKAVNFVLSETLIVNWVCRAAIEGDSLNLNLETIGGQFVPGEAPTLPFEQQYLQPISGPSIDTEETGDKSLENALAAGDLSWV